MRLKAWWKAGALRPPEGETFVVEVTYRDSLPRPAQVLAWAGIGWRFRNTPVHRFGGANDGAWKTAAIPLPWDLIARMVDAVDASADEPDSTQLAFVAPADLPIARIAVRTATPEDEPRFYAECRRQIADEQASRRIEIPTPAVKDPPKLDGAIVAFPTDPWCRVFPDSPVPAERVGEPVVVRMCGNQIESAAFAVFANGAPLTHVEYQVTPLTNADGEQLAIDAQRRVAEYALIDRAWAPVRLWPAYATDVEAGRDQWCFIDLKAKRGEAKPGRYAGTIRITATEGKAELPIRVEVLPVELLTLAEAGVTACSCFDKLPPLHDIDFERRYGYTGCLLWAPFDVPTAAKDGKLAFDFTYADDWMKGLAERGFTRAVWYQGGDSAGLPGTLVVLQRLAQLCPARATTAGSSRGRPSTRRSRRRGWRGSARG